MARRRSSGEPASAGSDLGTRPSCVSVPSGHRHADLARLRNGRPSVMDARRNIFRLVGFRLHVRPPRAKPPMSALRKVIVVALFGLTCIFIFVYQDSRTTYLRTLPHVTRPEAGRIYPLVGKGSIVYLTQQENRRLDYCGILAVGLAVATGVFGVWLRVISNPAREAAQQRRAAHQKARESYGHE